MASISTLSFNVISCNSNFSNSSLFPLPRKSSKRQVMTCSGRNNSNQNSPKEEQELPNMVAHRRNVLLGLGGLYSTLATNPSAIAAPILPPDLDTCTYAEDNAPENLDCCPPYSDKIIDFRFPSNQPLRERPAAHLVTDDYLEKYEKATQLMKALPPNDPRNFIQQANVHCAYCNGAYSQVGHPKLKIQVHNSWLFFPFHRWYLYFYERILGSLINDPTFGLPFWNYDAPDGMRLPSIYNDSACASSLYDNFRNEKHQPPTIIDLNYHCTDKYFVDPSTLISYNLSTMHRQVVSGAKTSKTFLGSPYRAGYNSSRGSGTVENVPHGPVHDWSGDNKLPRHEDMGTFYSAARDPLFFSHHSNVDRLWSIWKTLDEKRKDFVDQDWLESGFLFYDENKNLVRVKVKDCLDTNKLGYAYQNVPIPWLNAKPTPSRTKVSLRKSSRKYATFPFVLDDVVSVNVKRPKTLRSRKEKEEEEEIVVIEGIEFDENVATKFDVLINDEDKDVGPGNTEFAGSFVNVPHAHQHKNQNMNKTTTNLRVEVTELLEDLKVEGDDSLVVTLVPRGGKGLVKINNINIVLEG